MLDSQKIWCAWQNFIDFLVERGVPKISISQLSELPATGKLTNRWVQYTKNADYPGFIKKSERPIKNHHNTGAAKPWESERIAGELLAAMQRLAALPDEYLFIKIAAQAALESLNGGKHG